MPGSVLAGAVIGTPLGADFDDFVVQASPGLLRLARRLTGGSSDAEDLLQAGLLRVAGRWRTARENPVAYARKVLVNLAADGYRRKQSRPPELLSDRVEGIVTEQVGADGSNREVRDMLLAGLRALPPKMRAIVVLRYWEDFSVEETAAILNCPEGTVKSLSARGLKRLRSSLDVQEVLL